VYEPDVTDNAGLEISNSIIVYTTNKVIDSAMQPGLPVIVKKNHTEQALDVQLLQCSLTLASQDGKVDAATNKMLSSSISPMLSKNHSKWHVYEAPPNGAGNTTSLLQSNSVSHVSK
jgi:hypothetical protein